MSEHRTSKLGVGFAVSFTAIGVVIISLLVTKIISFELGMLMLVASVAMHLGFGILIAVYRLLAKLE